MMSEFVASIFTALVISPIQAEISQTLDSAGASVETVQQSTECLTAAGPVLLRQAIDDPWWATATIVGISTGYQSPAQLLEAGGAACTPIVRLMASEEAQG